MTLSLAVLVLLQQSLNRKSVNIRYVELSSIRSDCCMFYVVSMQTGEWTILVYNLLVFLIILTFAGEDIL